MSSTITSLIFFSSLLSSLTSATCYWQNSTQAPNDQYSIATDDVACFPDQDNSPCCGTGWSCLSDGVCFIQQGTDDFYYRGTCTDKTWNSQQCPGWCFAQNNETSIPLSKCPKPNGEDWYCCPGDPDCDCDTGKDAVKLGASQPVTVTVIGSTSWPGYVSTSTPITAGNIGTTSTSSSLSSSVSSTTSTSPSPSSSSSSSSSNTTALAAGLGAGIGAAILLIGITACYFILRRRSHNNNKTSSPTTTTHPYQYQNPKSELGSGYTQIAQGSPTPRKSSINTGAGAGTGYYATTQINEKDGQKTYHTQELPAFTTATATSRENILIPVEMAADSSSLSSPNMTNRTQETHGIEGRIELA